MRTWPPLYSYPVGAQGREHRPIRIAIEALGIGAYGGGRSAILTLLQDLIALDKSNSYTILLSQLEPSLQTIGDHVRQLVAPTRNRFLVRLWVQIYLILHAGDFDLVHFTKNLGAFVFSSKSVTTIHDLTPLMHPEVFPKIDVWYWRYIQRSVLGRADCIIAISQSTASDLVRFYELPPERVFTIYNPIHSRFSPASKAQVEEIRRKYSLPEKYVLHVGRIDLKKNLTCLVRAFASFRSRGVAGCRLVLVGERYLKSYDSDLNPTIEGLGLTSEVLFLGGVPDADLPAIYSGAWVVAFPSLHEGFGLVPIEAMACGVPVIANRTGAIPEVVAEAALMVSPLNDSTLADALTQLTSDISLRLRLVELGLARAQEFKGSQSARRLLDLYLWLCDQ